jgi:ribose transport system permease protein
MASEQMPVNGPAARSGRRTLAGSGSGAARRVAAGSSQYAGVLSVLLLVSIFFTLTQHQFATYENVLNILQTNAALIVVCVGLTFVMIAGGFDLSVGGVLVLAEVILARLVTGAGLPAALAIPLVIFGGVLFGAAVNGVLIAKLGLSFFVVTLGTMTLTKGLALLITGGETQGLYDEGVIRWFGAGIVFTSALPSAAVIAILVLVAGGLVLRFGGFGRMVYAVGGNAEAARLAGINVAAVRIATYGIAGGLAGLAGVMDAGRLAAASPGGAAGIELTAGAAVLLGGTSFAGGTGTMLGTLFGALFLGVVQNGLIIAQISVYWQGVVTGFVLILSVAVDRLRQRGRDVDR